MWRVSEFAKLGRIDHGIMTSLAVFTGYVLNVGFVLGRMSLYRLLMGLISAFFLEVGIFVFNDVFNINEDRINAPDRPLVIGTVKVREAVIFGISTLCLGLFFSYVIGGDVFCLALCAVIVSMLYNVGIKKYGFLGNLIVAFSTALPFIYGGVLASEELMYLPTRIWYVFFIAFLATLGREVLKGIVDMEGDRRVGVKTIAVVFGTRAAVMLASLFILIAVLISIMIIPYVHNVLLYVLMLFFVDMLLIYSVYILIKKQDISSARVARKTTLIAMGLGIIAFLLSSI